MKVLVVDDSAIMRRILSNILQEKNVKAEDIMDAPNGKAALEILNSNDIAMVLLDWNMPELNGLDFVKIVRKIDKYKTLPIIMVTSEAAKYNVMEAIKAGVTDYLIKPVSAVMLKPKIAEYLK